VTSRKTIRNGGAAVKSVLDSGGRGGLHGVVFIVVIVIVGGLLSMSITDW